MRELCPPIASRDVSLTPHSRKSSRRLNSKPPRSSIVLAHCRGDEAMLVAGRSGRVMLRPLRGLVDIADARPTWSDGLSLIQLADLACTASRTRRLSAQGLHG